ncbi:helix-turn-helix domain-containing protein [Chengkuizengella sp. SCS-71B]|uniref:helix-turn-helix domain-containing protein n=1 Tax=Chengkuizengella sp. SCS-71B TaxID=3115290 RepID=UPI0032C22CD6
MKFSLQNGKIKLKIEVLNEFNHYINVNKDELMFLLIELLKQNKTCVHFKDDMLNHQHSLSITDLMKEYVILHLNDETLTLKKLSSEVFYMNRDYLGKLFKKETGVNFTQYVLNERIKKAKKMLEKSKQIKIQKVAKCIGYGNNSYYFSKVFKKHTGFSPREYKSMLLSSESD